MANHTEPFRRLALWFTGLVVVACILLIWPVRLLLKQEEAIGIVPFVPSRDVPAIICGLIVISGLLVYGLSKMRNHRKLVSVAIATTAIVVLALAIIAMMKLIFEDKPDLQQPIGDRRSVEGN